jgi:hypothetical protein
MKKDFVDFLVSNGYYDLKKLDDRYVAGLFKFMFTTAIIKIRIGNLMSYEDRWCYHSEQDARLALQNWDGTGEPTGWHRHPASGRRRENDLEYIMF